MLIQPHIDLSTFWFLAFFVYLGFFKKVFKTIKKIFTTVGPSVIGASLGIPIPIGTFGNETSEASAAPVITTTNNTGQIFSNIQGGVAISAPVVATGGGSAVVSSNSIPIPKTPIGEQLTGFPQIYEGYVSNSGYGGYGGAVSPALPSSVIYILIGGIFLVFLLPIILSQRK